MGDLPGRYVDSRDANSNSYWKMGVYVRIHVRAPSRVTTSPRPPLAGIPPRSPPMPHVTAFQFIPFIFGLLDAVMAIPINIFSISCFALGIL